MAMDALVRHSSLQQKKHGLLKEQLHLVKRKDSDGYEIEKIPDPLSFEKGFFLLIRACQLLAKHTKGVVLVGLAGPSGAGKSVFTEKVSNFMPGISVISMDNYNDSNRIIDGNFDDPRVTDYEYLLDNIKDLKDGKAVDIPIYDFKTSCRTGYRRIEAPSSRIVIIEGIYALSEKLRPVLDLRVSVTGGVHFDLVKRVLRDINRSGQAPEDIIQQVSETVYPMYKAFIEPDLETAHIRIVNKFNPFSGLQSPTYILKSPRIADEEQIREVLSSIHTEATEETYDIYLLPPGEDPETCQSYLRMRNRDGRYSLMFEECLTDSPFLISPRITFEVSVRLLGGLMALGYTIATILKRVSKVYTNDSVSVKVDKLEQLHRRFIQVQGKDREVVREAAKNLGLDGSYVPHPYIEQIKVEKLTSEVMAIPEDLKTKLILETPASSPAPSFSWISDIKQGPKNLHSKSWTKPASRVTHRSMSMDQSKSKLEKQQPLWNDTYIKGSEERCPDSPASPFGEQVITPWPCCCYGCLCSLVAQKVSFQGFTQVSEQIVGLNEKMDELLVKLGDMKSRISSCSCNPPTRQGSNAVVGSSGNGNSYPYPNGYINTGNGHSPSLINTNTVSYMDHSVVEELRALARGQYQLTTQLDIVSNFVRQNTSQIGQHKGTEKRGWWEDFLGKSKTTEVGLATAIGLVILGLGGVAGMLTLRTSGQSR